MHAIFNSVLQIVEPGDEVIVIDPGFDYYSQIGLFGGKAVPVTAREQNGYKVALFEGLMKEQLEGIRK